MKYLYLILLALWLVPAAGNPTQAVVAKSWIHGAQNCKENMDPAIDVLAVSPDTYILRQNKCINVEAPFIYVFFGQHTVFVQDTGATKSADEFPIYDTIQQLIDEKFTGNNADTPTILVTHSHGHSDHTAGDDQFRGQENVVLVEGKLEAVIEYFDFAKWPMGEVLIDLGGRELTLFPIPGHQDASIAVYDSHTQWLLTGDTFYPGRLYVLEWEEYKTSIQKLVNFTSTHPVTAIMGTHIEISSTLGVIFEFGLDYQPNEAALPLTIDDLKVLNTALIEMGDKPQKKTLDKFIISPVGPAKKLMGKILGWVF
ncbi:MAG: glyoxylase-like metal-dependent hydrolase (beta-lactamase superfamily II) [Glaciecola sp.]|jgi:glyoxylase-like metal-dependent hydrolase (beta-lactamase superfamily II)